MFSPNRGRKRQQNDRDEIDINIVAYKPHYFLRPIRVFRAHITVANPPNTHHYFLRNIKGISLQRQKSFKSYAHPRCGQEFGLCPGKRRSLPTCRQDCGNKLNDDCFIAVGDRVSAALASPTGQVCSLINDLVIPDGVTQRLLRLDLPHMRLRPRIRSVF